MTILTNTSLSLCVRHSSECFTCILSVLTTILKARFYYLHFFQMDILGQRETELVIQGGNGVSGWTIRWTVCLCLYLGVKRTGLYHTVGEETPLRLARRASPPLLWAAREAVFLQGCLQRQGGFTLKRLVLEAQLLGSCSSLLMSCSLGK